MTSIESHRQEQSCPKCGATTIQGRSSCHMCYAKLPQPAAEIPKEPARPDSTPTVAYVEPSVMVYEEEPAKDDRLSTDFEQDCPVEAISDVFSPIPLPVPPTANDDITLPAPELMDGHAQEIADEERPLSQELIEESDNELVVQVTLDEPVEELSQHEPVDEPVDITPAAINNPSAPSEWVPEFLKSDAGKKTRHHCQRKPAATKSRKLHRTAGWLLVFMTLALAYAAWLYKPRVQSDHQLAIAAASRIALAINDRDYTEIHRNTIWNEPYRDAFRTGDDIRRFCASPKTNNSPKLRRLAELWQMKHTVVVGGKQIGRNSISYALVDTSGNKRSFDFTVTRTPSNLWKWDISYDYRLAPSDIPLLNNIIVRSRLQDTK